MRQTEIEALLPAVFRQTIQPGSPLAALLAAMEALHAPDEAVLDRLDSYFDPYRAPEPFLALLTRWVDLDQLLIGTSPPTLPSGAGALRELIASAAYLSQWRGTARGLLHSLATATATPGFRVDEHLLGDDGFVQPYHIRVHAPAAARHYTPLIEQIIALEKPAYVTHDLVFDDSPDGR